jgi:hypothetical protein
MSRWSWDAGDGALVALQEAAHGKVKRRVAFSSF